MRYIIKSISFRYLFNNFNIINISHIEIYMKKLPAISNNYGVTLEKIRFIVTATHVVMLNINLVYMM